MDKVITERIGLIVLRELAHLSEIDLVVILEAVEYVLEVLCVARNIESDCYDGYEVVYFRLLELL
jgi:hypothetical protein